MVSTVASGPKGMKQRSLGTAKSEKNDELYTEWTDIEREMNAYLEYDPDVFRDKVILLPCDDPEWSNFTKFFALHFVDLGIRKLISTSFAAESKPPEITYQPTLFETEARQFDKAKTRTKGKKFVLELKDINGDRVINIDDLQWDYLEGDGDFQSDEVTGLRDEADFIITNPPFSQWRPFVTWLSESGKRFSVIGNVNAITYSEIFPLVTADKMWLGVTRTGTGQMWFRVHDGFPIRSGQRIDEDGVRYQTIGNSAWFTNIDHGRRHQPLQLMSAADNIKFSKHPEVRGVGYKRYDNYDAIEVPFIDAIPSDCDDVMGVPITFLGKYNPDQFELVGTTESNDPNNVLRTRWYSSQECRDAYRARFGKPGVYDLNASGVVEGVKVFKRVLIRRKGDA